MNAKNRVRIKEQKGWGLELQKPSSLQKKNKTTQTTWPSARKPEITSFIVPDLDLFNDSHMAHGVTRCQSTAKVSSPLLYSKITGEMEIAFVHCCLKEDTLMLITRVLEWHIPGRCFDMGWILLQQKDKPCILCWRCIPKVLPRPMWPQSHTCEAVSKVCWYWGYKHWKPGLLSSWKLSRFLNGDISWIDSTWWNRHFLTRNLFCAEIPSQL